MSRRRRDSTVELSRVGVGGVYWALVPADVRPEVRNRYSAAPKVSVVEPEEVQYSGEPAPSASPADAVKSYLQTQCSYS